jgi:hypothetical protein
MPVQLQTSVVIEKPLAKVFQFVAVDHVRNHPRWDPDIKLEQISDGPIGVGTLLRRQNTRSGTPVTGTMEVTEFEPDKAIGMEIHDGPAVMYGRLIFEAIGENQTKITNYIDLPDMAETADMSFLTNALERRNLKMRQLMESEI